MKKRIGFHKSEQGIFDAALIERLKGVIVHECNATIVDLDFRDAVIIGTKAYVGDFCLNDLDLYFWHDSVRPRTWGADNYFTHVLDVIARDVIVINTGESTRITNDKFLAHSILRDANLPVGDFALVRSADQRGMERIFEDFGEDVLLKPRFGGWGVGIMRATSKDDLFSAIEYAQSFHSTEIQILIEKFYPNDLAKWISVVVFGEKVICGYKKPLLSDDIVWKIYDPRREDGRGQKTVYAKPPEDLATTAVAAAQAIDKDIIGFDFIATDEGYKIIDENGRPGLYAHCLEKVGIDVCDEMAQLIKLRLSQERK